jgi:hypothetical protein
MKRTRPKPPNENRPRQSKAPRGKRKPPFYFNVFAVLKERLCAALNPRPPRLTGKQELDLFAAGKPIPRIEWERRQRELERAIGFCFFVEP